MKTCVRLLACKLLQTFGLPRLHIMKIVFSHCLLVLSILGLQIRGVLFQDPAEGGDENTDPGTAVPPPSLTPAKPPASSTEAPIVIEEDSGRIKDMKTFFFIKPIRIDNKIYYISKTGVRNYWVAVAICKMIGTLIVEIDTENKLFLIQSFLASGTVGQYNIKAFFTGLTDLEEPGRHVFQNTKELIRFYEWACHRHPHGIGRCTGLVDWCSWGLSKIKCDFNSIPVGFICESDVKKPMKSEFNFKIFKESLFLPPIAYDKSDYILSRLIVPEIMTAFAACGLVDGHLAEVNSDEALKTLSGALKLSFKNNFDVIYISGTDVDEEGKWFHQGSGQELTFKNFSDGGPTGGRYANCLIIRDDWKMEDASCQRKNMEKMDSFMCQVSQNQGVDNP